MGGTVDVEDACFLGGWQGGIPGDTLMLIGRTLEMVSRRMSLSDVVKFM